MRANTKSRAAKDEMKLGLIYPSLEGYELVRSNVSDGDAHRVGYATDRARKCVCGYYPIFEQYVLDKEEAHSPQNTKRKVPAEVFVGICPRCERRTAHEGPLEMVLQEWNRQEFTHDSEMVNHPCEEMNTEGVRQIAELVLAGEIQDAVQLVKDRRTLTKKVQDEKSEYIREQMYIELKNIVSELRTLEKHLKTHPIFFEQDPDAVLSRIRYMLYPDLTTEERLEIPLHLDKL